MRALITGITGNIGSYLAEYLAASKWDVSGLVQIQDPRQQWIRDLVPGALLIPGDLTDTASLQAAVETAVPDVVFNLAALSDVGLSWEHPALTTEVTGLGALRLLEACRNSTRRPRFIQASTADMFGRNGWNADETTQFAPGSPYGTAKLMAHQYVTLYRDVHGMHASAAIMYNAESPRRGERFVSHRIARAVARIAEGRQDKLPLGPQGALRDWGWAQDYAEALALMAQAGTPDDYVIATGEAHTVQTLARRMFASVGLDMEQHVTPNPSFRRINDTDLKGNPAKIEMALGWKHRTTLNQLAQRMVAAEREAL